MRLHVLARQIWVIRRRLPRRCPDARRTLPRTLMVARRLLAALDAGGLRAQAKCFALRRTQRAANVQAPCLPAESVAPVLHAARRQAVQVQQVGGIASAVRAARVASVQPGRRR
jgi:hypothetical protein